MEPLQDMPNLNSLCELLIDLLIIGSSYVHKIFNFRNFEVILISSVLLENLLTLKKVK